MVAEDSKSNIVGSWKTTDSLVNSASCDGLMHNAETEKSSIEAVWYASSNVTGDIMIKYKFFDQNNQIFLDLFSFRATLIENDNTIYVDCYNIILTPRVII